jgi:hypothetical protein
MYKVKKTEKQIFKTILNSISANNWIDPVPPTPFIPWEIVLQTQNSILGDSPSLALNREGAL